ncbi:MULTISPECIES: NAD(P)H-hydrate dehydratase [Collinsella]|uniref:NAD(P)H-hydrate dehydratase n=1 Tax=Collinsella TaxID=102106 RepID=UPI000B39B023|nr:MULTISPECIES: NAD(P)H-hydrate dehydratase [Collinsella]MBM6908291.1 NAD(P)H-hydrate dehydratase [Collinsella intestinalis]OUO63236.1 bifunctional ADP-dependent NAD(P)H-hydrate dehydratase/NAD(P)H-hydrate epimerase [Collinsella sp. An268]
MKPILSCDEVRELEDIIEKQGTSKAELMELAGEFAAAQVERLSPKHVLVLAGFGNNGGDGWVAADILSQKGIAVDVVSPVEPDEIPATLARHVARRTAGRDVTVYVGPSRDELSELILKADVVLDAILGTGFHGALRPPFNIWIDALNEAGATVVSVDVPSGLDAQTGAVAGTCVRADVTATMFAPKIGLFSASGPDFAGEVVCGELYEKLDEVIGDVSHAAEHVDADDLIDYLEPLPSDINKYTRGSVLVVAGSAQYPGAAIMAAKAAARAGAGYVAVAAPEPCANLIRLALPSVPVFAMPADSRGAFGAAAPMQVSELASRYGCVLCGPGMTTSAGAMGVVTSLLALDVPLVLDADALNCLAAVAIDGIDATPELYRREAPLIMTPHYGELARLVHEDAVGNLAEAMDAAQRIVWGVGSDNLIVVAKGPTTAVVGVEKVLLPLSGPASLATAGSGDVLAGIIAGATALNRDRIEAWELLASYAVALHSYTGFAAAERFGEKSVIATDLIDCIGDAMRLMTEEVIGGLENEVASSAKEA